MKDEIPFSHEDYIKLAYPLFLTIRRRDKYPDVGEKVPIKLPEYSFQAMIVSKMKKELGQIPTLLLRYDTARVGKIPENREEAMQVLNSFYNEPLKMNEKVTIILCLAVYEGDE